MAESPKLTTTVRTESGKGAARRARREGQVPAVLYGHGNDAQHLLLPARELAAILRYNGLNAVIDLDIEGKSQLALTRQVDVHPIRDFIQHVDLLIVKRGEKVTVEVTLSIEGLPGPGGLVVQEASTVEIEADALNIPEHIVVSVEDKPVGTIITAADVELPTGATLVTSPDAVLVAVDEAKAAAEPEDEEAAEDEAAEEAAE
ncbi:50S ribosomal protein L25/general stress protein Ctc [Gordonia sp. VNK21]|uniref:50S ribosomal protein L25/general stress protein Ctc n=1 Tax=Gordonia sp. VNK21 TaxID=3382483 RepID=UPI0038D40570